MHCGAPTRRNDRSQQGKLCCRNLSLSERIGVQGEPLADGARYLAMRLSARISHLGHAVTLGIERLMLFPIIEGETIHVVDEGLGRRALGQHQRVVRHFDMIVGKDFGTLRSRTIERPLTSAPACTSTPSTRIAWSGDSSRSRTGRLSPSALALILIGSTRSGSAKISDTVCRPSQDTGSVLPSAVTTTSPAFSVSIATSPSGVRIMVPAMKQIAVNLSVSVALVTPAEFSTSALAT